MGDVIQYIWNKNRAEKSGLIEFITTYCLECTVASNQRHLVISIILTGGWGGAERKLHIFCK